MNAMTESADVQAKITTLQARQTELTTLIADNIGGNVDTLTQESGAIAAKLPALALLLKRATQTDAERAKAALLERYQATLTALHDEFQGMADEDAEIAVHVKQIEEATRRRQEHHEQTQIISGRRSRLTAELMQMGVQPRELEALRRALAPIGKYW